MNKIVLFVAVISLFACKDNTITPPSNNPATTPQTAINSGTTTEIVIDEGSADVKAQRMSKVSKGSLINNAKYIDRAGTEFSFDQLKGKTVVVDFWATWCAPCIEAMPAFDKLANDFSTNKNLVFLKLSVDEKKPLWENYIKQKQHGANSYWIGKNDNNPLYWLTYKKLNYEGKDVILESLPRYAIIGPDGAIIDNNAPTPQTNKLLATINSITI